VNYIRRQDKTFRLIAVFVAAVVVLTITLAAIPAQAQTYKDLHDFNPNNGNDPNGLISPGLIPQGRDGNMYGTSTYGGTSGSGTVFTITSAGKPTILASLDAATGQYPYCGLTFGTDGNFYGVTPQGGNSGAGSVFKMSPAGTLTVLHQFTNNGDGGAPTCPPTQAGNGTFYGVTTGLISGVQGVSTFYKVTSSGAFTTLHIFASSEGIHCSGLTLGSDGDFYGGCELGGANNQGTLYKVSTAGHVTVLRSMTTTDGLQCQGTFLVQAKDGNYYGLCSQGGSTNNDGTIYQLKSDGAYKVLYNFTGGTDGAYPYYLALGADGNLYGTATYGGNNAACVQAVPGCGTIFKITTAGVFKVLYTFDHTHGAYPQSSLTLDTDGIFYGDTAIGGAYNNGVFFSLDVGFKPFVSLVTTSGEVGSKIGILGQGFSKSSVVKFAGVQATEFTLTGTTYISATVPAGAVDGKVTVTTGTTTLTSLQTFTVHNSWRTGTAMPTAVYASATGVLNNEVYVVGGYTTSPTADVQIYNPAANTWSAGVSLPTATSGAAAAVVSDVLYVIGGFTSTVTNAVWAYNPKTKTWSGEAAMPTARDGAVAVVQKGIIYVAGGYNGTDILATVESYNPATNTWTEEAPMLGTKDYPATGLIGTTIVAADGANAPGEVTGDTEGYNATTNTWTNLATDPAAREGTCSGVVGSLFYDVGGYINNGGAATTVNESLSLSADKWTTTLAPIPQGAMFPGSAVYNGQLYCFGGEAKWLGSPINNVQIYQP